NAINPTAGWRRVPADWNGGQDFSGLIAACFHENMGVLNIRPLAGGLLGSTEPPKNLFVMTTGTNVDNEMRCAAAGRASRSDGSGTPAQAALRFVLNNRDLASRVIGITSIAQLDEAIEAVAQGPLPTAAISKLDALWANDFH